VQNDPTAGHSRVTPERLKSAWIKLRTAAMTLLPLRGRPRT
jgi:hypothetical protein